MARMLSTVRAQTSNYCTHGCCRGREMIGHGHRQDRRVRRWTRGREKSAWQREERQHRA